MTRMNNIEFLDRYQGKVRESNLNMIQANSNVANCEEREAKRNHLSVVETSVSDGTEVSGRSVAQVGDYRPLRPRTHLRQDLFVAEYRRDWNGTKATIRMAERLGITYMHPEVIGSKLLHHPRVQALVAEAMAKTVREVPIEPVSR